MIHALQFFLLRFDVYTFFLGTFGPAFKRMHAYRGVNTSGFKQMKPIEEIRGIFQVALSASQGRPQ